MREKIARFMYGRNGIDHFSKFLVYAALIFILLDVIVGGGIFYAIGLAMMVYGYFRAFSKNINKRRMENAKYYRIRSKVVVGVKNWWDRMKQSKDYCFFRCPSCKAMLRVPRGKGKIRVTCRKCGNAFEKRT